MALYRYIYTCSIYIVIIVYIVRFRVQCTEDNVLRMSAFSVVSGFGASNVVQRILLIAGFRNEVALLMARCGLAISNIMPGCSHQLRNALQLVT